MNTYDIRCPNCGRMNRDLLLEDSGGWMECEECGCISMVHRKERERGLVRSRPITERKLPSRDTDALRAV